MTDGSSYIHVTAWVDPLVDARGYPARSSYAELFWLPVIGPSVTLLMRRLVLLLEMCPDGLSLDTDELGRQLGLGPSMSKHAPLPRAIDRCVRFGMAKRLGPEQLSVRRFVGPLSQQHVAGLPPMLQEMHHGWANRGKERAPAPLARVPSPKANRKVG